MSPTRAAPFRRSPFSLQLKVVVGLILALLTPLLLSASLVQSISKHAADYGALVAANRKAAIAHAIDVYKELLDTTKNLESEVARRIAADPVFARLEPPPALRPILERESGLVELALVDVAEHPIARAERPVPSGAWHVYHVEQPIPAGGTLRFGFAVPDVQTDYLELKRALDETRSAEQTHSALPEGYQLSFLAIVGGVVLLTIVLGIFAARVVTRRVSALIATTRAVSAGKLDARVALPGKDEMAELAVAFNTMLDDLAAKRDQIEYLQRIGAWQDVARKLAHEIKNPLTPIQLAVQQTVSSYRGDDPRFKKQLADTGEIVEEEIAGLRRLVDTFRTLGQLPKVEAAPIALAEVIEDLVRDPQFAPHLAIAAGPAVTVRADRLLLKRVLANLVENGIHAGQEAGATPTVRISWAPQDRAVEVYVDDQGKGVAADAHDRIFEPYVTTKPTGTGLGLAISKKIALEHDGDLTISPERAPAPASGARFVLRLPLA
jgi:nitrogen fixation/metabolism regulation signal transduction histidine kinase